MKEIAKMSLTRRSLVLSGAALTLAGCSSVIGPPPPRQIFVLQPDFQPMVQAPHVAWALNVSVPVAPDSLDTERIALINAPNVLDYFANAQWTDRVPVLVQSLLVDAFEKSGRIVAVGRGGQGINGDYMLETELHDFEAYYAVLDAAPKVVVRISATLIGTIKHDVAGTLRSDHEAQAAGNDLSSITAAFNQATKTAIGEIVSWSLHASAPAAGTPPEQPFAEPIRPSEREHHHHYR